MLYARAMLGRKRPFSRASTHARLTADAGREIGLCRCFFSEELNTVFHLKASSSRKWVIVNPKGLMGINSLGTRLLKRKMKLAV